MASVFELANLSWMAYSWKKRRKPIHMARSPLSALKIRFSFIGLIILTLLISPFILLSGCSTSQADDNKEYLLLCYTKEFGQRFSLPQGKSVDLSEGLLAIGFGQSKRTGMRLYLYLDSSVDIYSPKECGDFCDHNRFHYFLNFNEKDGDIHTKNEIAKFNRIFLQSKRLNHSQEGDVSSAEHVFIKKDVLPGLTVVAVRGFISQIFECEYGPIEILVQKNNRGDSIFWPNGPVADKRVYRFDIPDKLTKHIMNHLREDCLLPEDNPIDVHYL